MWHGFASCADGSSNTIAASESATVLRGNTSADGYDNRRGGISAVTGLESCPADGACYARADLCLSSALDAGDDNRIKNPADTWRGAFFHDGRYTSSKFHTVLPPNSPSCVVGTGANGWAGIYSANSYHPGGVNAVFLDAAVVFIHNSIDAGRAADPRPLSGPSPTACGAPSERPTEVKHNDSCNNKSRNEAQRSDGPEK